MKIYLEDKITEIKNPDLEKGRLVSDSIHVHKDEVSFIADEGHYETLKEYENGGKDVQFIVDKKGQAYKSAEDYDEEIYIYKPFSENELEENILADLRNLRECQCFSIINRGGFWLKSLNDEQKIELENWYKLWLKVTETKEIPEKPEWLR